ncbi:MAG: hypothetical protein HY347_01405 [candidate division NC10 bacterium]|nr:hypothetical protein [candidate division NC10 bacterium]
MLGANVEAVVSHPDGFTDTVGLLDDGLHGDGSTDDGLYGNLYLPPPGLAGAYIIAFSASGTNAAGELFSKGALATARVVLSPIANAGPDQTVNEGATVTLDGTGSSDPDGDPLIFSWTQTTGPMVTLSNPTSPTPSFEAPCVGPAGTLLTFQLITNDGLVDSAPDTVVVTVQDLGLILSGPTPGLAGTVNTLEVSCATPDAKVFFVHGFQSSSTAVPGCPGVTVDILNPKLTARAVADTSGHVHLSGFVPNQASGKTILLQAVERSNCSFNNLVTHTFP